MAELIIQAEAKIKDHNIWCELLHKNNCKISPEEENITSEVSSCELPAFSQGRMSGYILTIDLLARMAKDTLLSKHGQFETQSSGLNSFFWKTKLAYKSNSFKFLMM